MKYLATILAFTMLLMMVCSNGFAALDLARTPLFMGSSVDPNVFFAVDDSTSMDYTILSKKYWHPYAYDPDSGVYNNSSSTAGDLIDDGNMDANSRSFGYVYDSSDNSPAVHSTAESVSNGVAYTESDWRMRSAAVNVVYYDPAVEYEPWPGFPDASFAAARSDPQEGTDGYDETRDLGDMQTGDLPNIRFVYEVAVDDSGFTGDRPLRGTNTNKTSEPNGLIDLWDTHARFTVGSSSVTMENYVYDQIDSDDDGDGDLSLNPRVSSTKSLSGSACFEDLGGGEVACRTIKQTQQNIANWYQYARRRSFVVKGAIGAVVTDSPHFRFGLNLVRNDNLFVEMPAADIIDYSTHNTAMLNQLYSYEWHLHTTHLRRGLARAGEYYKGSLSGKDSPITDACQHNFTLLLTDGYWNGLAASGTYEVDNDGRHYTLADVARYYYINDLRTDLDNEMQTSSFDMASHQHMVTYGVAFGVEGDLKDTDEDGWPNPPLSESDEWNSTQPLYSDPAKIDDLWHASYNSRGDFLQAQTPPELLESLKDAMASIGSRTATAAAIATNSTRLTDGSLIYQARFNSGDWSGRILAYELDSITGVVNGLSWTTDEADKIPDSTDRHIYTINGSSGLSFEEGNWGDLSDAQRTALQAGGDEQNGKDRLNWLRGDQSLEKNHSGGYLRQRSRLLGDIVNSDPLVVGALNFNYQQLPDAAAGQSTYEAFLSDNESRKKMLYVGANDGMLHAFDASSGVEQFAYLPEAVFGDLAKLTAPDYSHRYFVDGSPRVGDAYIDGGWKTILLGTLNGGGRSVFALDITDPDNFDESKVLWEFSDDDLGYTFGQAVIGRMKDGTGTDTDIWVAIFGNGYGSDNHKAFLYIVNLETGALLRKIDTEFVSDKNGLSMPALLENSERIIEYAYAGDLQGNLWKFDLTHKNKTNWKVAYTSGNVKVPLFQARGPSGSPQPITAAAEIGEHSEGGSMIYFGTGKFFETGDNKVGTDTQIQSFYGIHDDTSDYIEEEDRSTLLQQNILAEFDYNDQAWRMTSSVTDEAITDKDGWFMDLVSPESGVEGEMVVSLPLLRHGRVIFFTLIPSQDRCSGGGASWLMELDAETGNCPDAALFDSDGDGDIDEDDAVIVSEDGEERTVYAAGLKIDGIIDTPAVVTNGSKETKYAGTSSGDIIQILEPGETDIGSLGRRSWRELR